MRHVPTSRFNRRTVLSSADAVAAGLSPAWVRSQIEAGHWQRLHRGIYATFSGPVPRRAQLQAALAAAGDGAVLSHRTAAEIDRLVDEPADQIHVTVPYRRRVSPIAGVVVHVSRRLEIARHPTAVPSRTRIEATVFDVIDGCFEFDDVIGWLTAACSRRLTIPRRLSEMLDRRGRTRWRRDILLVLGDIDAGCQSVLEVRYRRDVEAAHGLPAGHRQEPHARAGGMIYDDVLYPDFALVVELDGRLAHPYERKFRDRHTDNIAARRGDVTLHYGWADVTASPCAVAAEVASLLKARGWTGIARKCTKSTCGIGETC